ncbi:MBL fold metallo-hydrolase [Bacteroides caecigallinarum]|uniref:MBL fold metallo-hydrolase n=1 Tax=Bacteroides caecigallinarum TaxID=1411144 RepID=UPI00195B624A|nr:MBL fold metallo-hydrolase [Bacteroides caecigallinarum]MBM6882799.1 MBL fold metallo-hydrolase [Bacteroides caecigallinarum]
MKNIIAKIEVLMMVSMLLLGCTGQSKQSKEKSAKSDTADIQVQQNDNKLLSTMELDNMKVTWIRDNANDRIMPLSLFPDATKAQIDSLSLQDGVPASVSTFLVEKDGKRILFDAGMGAPDSKLPEGLKALNINPSEIDYLYITHFHGDHIGGMMKEGVPVFPNAQVYVSKVEYDAWMKMPADKKSQVENTMKAYKDRLHLFAFGDTLPCDVVAMEAAGHTPGHTVFRTGNLLVIGDLMHGAALQLKYPEICATYDMDKSGAVKSRKHYVQYARENGLVIAGMHLPVPAFMK